MKNSARIFAVLVAGMVIMDTGCTTQHQTVAQHPPATTSQPKPITRASEAIMSADILLKAHGFDWGEPTQILRTVSNWYRMEYARDSTGRERVVLVNPENGQAEFPLPR